MFGANDGWKLHEQRFHGSLLEKSDEQLKGSEPSAVQACGTARDLLRGSVVLHTLRAAAQVCKIASSSSVRLKIFKLLPLVVL